MGQSGNATTEQKNFYRREKYMNTLLNKKVGRKSPINADTKAQGEELLSMENMYASANGLDNRLVDAGRIMLANGASDILISRNDINS
jgi:hypothetical protein